jgi:hypothetical protein
LDPTDRLFKFGLLLPKLMANFQKAVNCGEILCVDESLLLFKGRLSFRQYVPLKRSRFGIKYFALVDVESKFLVKLFIYLGKGTVLCSTASVKEFGYGGSTVLTLMQDFLNKNHKVVVDNYFNGPKLQQHLKEKGTYALGTVRKNRKGMPKFGKKLQKGHCESYVSEGLILERWEDRREVLMLNSFIDHEMLPSPTTNAFNQREKPKSVLWYNKNMGGVDYIDKQLSAYKFTRKSIKWYKKFAFHLIELTVHNSYLVYKHFHPGKKTTFKDFILALVEEILEKNRVNRKRKIQEPSQDGSIGQDLHLPEKTLNESGKPIKSNCHHCYKLGKRRQTPYVCSACKKRLCIQGKDSCFKMHHQTPIPAKVNRQQLQDISNTSQSVSFSQDSIPAPDYSQITGYTDSQSSAFRNEDIESMLFQ